jgi:hypothetical protein
VATPPGDGAEGSDGEPGDAVRAEMAELRSRLERTESILAIQGLKARYAALVDRRHHGGKVADPSVLAAAAEAAADLFTEDGEWDGGPTLGRGVGRAAIARRLCDTTLLFGRHFFVSPSIEVDADEPHRARGRWELLSPCRDADGRDFWMSGVEEDEYQRIDGVWLHCSMRLTTVMVAPVDRPWRILG